MRKILMKIAAVMAALMLCSCSLENGESFDSSKESSIGGYVVPAEFTEEELEMQKTVELAAYSIRNVFKAFESYYGDAGEPAECKIIFEQPGDNDGGHTEKVYKITYPPFIDDQINELKDALTAEALAMFEENFALGEEVEEKSWEYWYDLFKENNDTPDVDSIAITVTEGDMLGEDDTLTAFPHIIELENLALYDTEAYNSVKALHDCFWNTAHITKKTDDTIKFAYIIETDGILTERTGILKNEDGWKLSWYMDWLE